MCCRMASTWIFLCESFLHGLGRGLFLVQTLCTHAQLLLDPYIKSKKKANFHRFFAIFSLFFPNIWPLAGPNIAKRGGPLQKLVRGDRQTHFGTFNFWIKPGFPI